MTAITCLVTGGAGFIGSHLAERLVADGHRVRVVDNLSTGSLRNLDWARGQVEFIEGDLTDRAVCDRVVRGVEVIFHLAALPSVARSVADPWASHDHNVNATLRLLLAAREAGARRVVFSSSSSVYGNTPVLPKVETMEPLPRSPYAAAKLAAEQYVMAMARGGLIEGVALRYFNVFGPRQNPHSAYAAAIPAFFKAVGEGRPAPLHGDGRQTRDFTYVENVVNANILAASQPAERVSGWPCNVGAGDRVSLLELLALIGEVSGRTVGFERLPERPGDVRDSQADLSRAREVLGYEASVTLREGLVRTWEWFRATQVPR